MPEFLLYLLCTLWLKTPRSQSLVLPQNKPNLSIPKIMLCSSLLTFTLTAWAGDCQTMSGHCSALPGWGERGGQRDTGRRARGHAHREGGLGHLAAVVRDAPAEAARDATAVVLLLAAHHRLHGVAAHPDGSLRPEGTAGHHHPAGHRPQTPSLPSPRSPPSTSESNLPGPPPREPAHTNNPTGNNPTPTTIRQVMAAAIAPHSRRMGRPSGSPTATKSDFSPTAPLTLRVRAKDCSYRTRSGRHEPRSPAFCLADLRKPLSRNGDHS